MLYLLIVLPCLSCFAIWNITVLTTIKEEHRRFSVLPKVIFVLKRLKSTVFRTKKAMIVKVAECDKGYKHS